MNNVERIKGAVKSRLISALGLLGIKVRQKNLVNVLARQSREAASLEAFERLLFLLRNLPAQNVILLIPDDMHKGLSFVRRQVGSPELLRLSDCNDPRKRPNIFLLKKDFLFQAHPVLKSHHGVLLKHFENPVWLLLSDGTIPDGAKYTMEELDSACSGALKSVAHGCGDTIFSVRPGTNDYQIVDEVAVSYLPSIKQWLSTVDKKTCLRIIDLGGHIGSFSLQINALLSGRCDIHIYEPEPSNFEQIKINIAKNQVDNITPFNLAVSSIAGKNTLYFNPEHSGAHQLGSRLSYETRAIPVEVVTLEAIFQKWANMPIDILKIDVEGSEYNALFPAPELVRHCLLIVGEAQRNKEHVPQDMIDFLQELGFSVTFSGDVQNCVTFCAVNKMIF
ncbi:MAG: FkbM family methyltransferase [Desulfarculales bacterium]|nr:FkbM family methyltransferase [Desulfarculales bacterium]